MSDSQADLQNRLDVLQTELDRLQKRLAALEAVISIDIDENDVRRVYVECNDFVVRPAHDTAKIAVHIGANEVGSYLNLHYSHPETLTTAISLSVEGDGQPHIQLRGQDFGLRADMTLEADAGLVAVFNADAAPGAVMRARPGGGSLAVLQPNGRARAVLVHDQSGEDAENGGNTELIFATAEANTVMKLRADAGGAILSMGPVGQPDAAVIVAREEGPALLMHSPENENSISMMAMGAMSEICVHQGAVPGDNARASLSSGDFGSSLTLHEPGGDKGVDLAALSMASNLSLHDEHGLPCVQLSHHYGSHSSLSMERTAGHEGYRVLTSKDISSVEVKSPDNEDTKFIVVVAGEKPMALIQKNKRALLLLGEGEQGGVVCAYGPTAEQSGMATLSGGPLAGALITATADGTAQLTLDATDHGGRLLVNNDLGFQRIAMGVYQESAGIHLNNTGSMGVQMVATPKGGVVTVSDPEGRTVATLPERDDDDDSNHWGQLPEGF